MSVFFRTMVVGILAGMLWAPLGRADDTAEMTAMLLVKLAAFDYAVGGSDVTIYVMGDPAMAEQLNRLVGTRMRDGFLTAVETGSGIPASEPTVFFVGRDADAEAAVAYTRAHGILSAAGSRAHVEQGVTLGIILQDAMPVVLLNLDGSRAEGCNWHPGIMKLAKTVY